MEILPPELSDKVNKKIAETPDNRPDFLSIIGMVSYLWKCYFYIHAILLSYVDV